MKKILGLSVAALLVIAMVGGGTWAFFSDSESLADNTITAGTLTLEVGDGAEAAFTVSNVFPSVKGTADAWTLDNTGSIDGWLEVATTNFTDIDSAAADGAKLGTYVKLFMWIDTNGDGNLDNGEKYLVASDSSVATWSGDDDTALDAAAVLALHETASSFSNKTWGTSASPVLTIADDNENANTFTVNYYFPDTDVDQNDAQGDSLEVDLSFTLTQTGT